MKKIKIGNDFTFLWTIMKGDVPVNLSEAKNIKVYRYIGDVGRYTLEIPYEIVDDNILRIEVTPEIANRTGDYIFEVSYDIVNFSNTDGDEKNRVDTNAFTIVPRTYLMADDITDIPVTSVAIMGFKGEQGDKGDKGIQGEKGEKGDKGDTGEKGADGTMSFEDLTPEQKETLKGDQGEQGIQGLQGEKGDKGDKGDTGEQGIQGEKGDKGDAFVYEDFTVAQLETLKGDKGDKGEKGEQGIPGEKGEKGDTGEKGADGTMSFEDLTPEQKETLKGDQGEQGIQGEKGEKGDQGIQGLQGEKGEKGDPFIFEDFTQEQLELIKGDQGDMGIQGEPGLDFTYEDFTPEQLEALKGEKGDKGEQGEQGEAGSDAEVTKDNVEIALGFTPLPQSGGMLNSYVEKLVTIDETNFIDLNDGNVFLKTITEDSVFAINNAKIGAHSFTLIIEMNTVSELTFPTEVKWEGGEMPDMTEIDKTYILTFLTINQGTTWFGIEGGAF